MGLIDWFRSFFKDDKVQEPQMDIPHQNTSTQINIQPPNIKADKEKIKYDVPEKFAQFGVEKLIEHEGFRLDPYTDTQGFVTGGIGHKFTKADFTNFDPSWEREQKEKYWKDRFEEDLERAELHAIKLATKHGIDTTPENMYVLTDMTFNLGTAGVSKFKNFLTDLSKGDVDGAIKEMKYTDKESGVHSKWYKQVPNRVDSLAEILRSSNESS